MNGQKRIKTKYKQSYVPMGILHIKNLSNGKIFIAGSKNLQGKLNSIRFQLDRDLHMKAGLQKDYIKFGKENFRFEILDYLEPKEDPQYDCTEDLTILEEMWLEKLQPFDERGNNKRKKII